MKTLVTGGIGNVGQYVVRELLEHGHRVTCLDLREGDEERCEYVVGDLRDLSAMEQAVKGHGAVCHLAAIPAPRPREVHPDIMSINAMGTYNVFEAAVRQGVKKVAFASSICAGGWLGGKQEMRPAYFPIDEEHECRPEEPYSWSKLTGEIMARGFTINFDVSIVCLRLCNVRSVETEKGAGNLNCGIEWTTVAHADVASAFRLALESDLKFGVYQIGSRWRYREDGSREDRDDILRQCAEHGVPMVKMDTEFVNGGATHTSALARRELGYEPEY